MVDQPFMNDPTDWWRTLVSPLSMPNLAVTLAEPQPLVAIKTILTLRYDFFISYRRSEAQQYASMLSSKLSEMGFRVFLASEQEIPDSSDEELRSHLKAALHSSAAIVHILSATPFGGEWTRLESDLFYEGRFGLTIGLITEVTPEDQRVIWHMRRQIDSVVIYEEKEGAWHLSDPSITTLLNLAIALSLYRVRLRLKPWIWLVPKSLRMRLHDKIAQRSRSCRRWVMAFLVYHGFVEPPAVMLEKLVKEDPR